MDIEKKTIEQPEETAEMYEGKMEDDQLNIASGTQNIRDSSWYKLVRDQYRNNGEVGAKLLCRQHWISVSTCNSIIDEIKRELAGEN